MDRKEKRKKFSIKQNGLSTLSYVIFISKRDVPSSPLSWLGVESVWVVVPLMTLGQQRTPVDFGFALGIVIILQSFEKSINDIETILCLSNVSEYYF